MMSELEQKINTQFDKWKLKITSNDRAKYSTYFYADFVELMALFSNGSTVSDSDVFERFKEEEIINKGTNSEDDDSSRANRIDADWEFVTDVCELLRSRSHCLNDCYPFEYDFSSNSYSIKLKENVDSVQEVYINLLICSNLDSFPDLKPILSSEFEVLSKEAIISLLKGWKVVSTGKFPDVKGTALDKINQLEDLLRIDVNTRYVNDEMVHGNQEYGLDIIAWKDFNDAVANKLILLIQCTCEKNWGKKTNDTHSWENFFHYQKLKPNHSLTIPYDIINNDSNNFFDLNKIKYNDILIMDRQRIMNEVKSMDLKFYNSLDSQKIVTRSIQIQESLV